MSVLAHKLYPLPEQGARFVYDGAWALVYARARLPTPEGTFSTLVVRTSLSADETVVLASEPVSPLPMVRLHSECVTGEVFHSLRCDCGAQLEAAKRLAAADGGVVLYLRQEGRGIGLGNKIRAYALQEQGLDTYEANEHLGFDRDLRDYQEAALVLRLLGIFRVRLMTNNPSKMFGLKGCGIEVVDRVPVAIAPGEHSRAYLQAKAREGHALPLR
jgi:GTP cyclohydrolase II